MISKISIFIIYLAMFAMLAIAQDVSITDFEGGLNTNSSVLKLKPNQGSCCLNWDIGNGILEKRKGYLRLLPTGAWPSGDTLAGDDPNIGLFSFRRADGVRRIVGIASQAGDTTGCDPDSSGLGWLLASPGLPATPPGSGAMYYLQEQASRRYYNYIYQGATPHWTYWNDNCYMTNGRQRPLVFHPYNEMGRDGYCRELVPLTPGEPLIVPMDVSGNLDGEYYYMIGHSEGYGIAFGADEIVNADFEAWTNDSLDNWDTLPGATGWVSEATDTKYNGTSSMRLISRGYNPFNGAYKPGVRQTVRANPDSSYEVDVWFNRISDNGSGLWVVIEDTVNSISIDGYCNYFTTGGNWNQSKFLFRNTGNRDSIELSIYIYMPPFASTDTIWVDSITIKQARINRQGVVTKPVLTFNENVWLGHFPWQTIVSGYTDVTDTGYDTLNIDIYRTKANPGKITKSDKFWLIESIDLLDSDQIDTFTYIDTLPDDSLGKGSWITSTIMDTLLLGRDSSLALTGVRVGAPTWIKSGDGVHDVGYIFYTPTADSDIVASVSYIITYYDTLINAESDSSRSLHIQHNFNDSVYVIGLPLLPGGKNHLTRKIYKSYINVLAHFADSIATIKDTTVKMWRGTIRTNYNDQWRFTYMIEPGRFITDILDNGRDIYISPHPSEVHANSEHWNTFVNFDIKYYDVVPSVTVVYDTTTSPYKLIGEIKNSDSVFVDSITWDSTQKGKHYFKSEAPYNLNYITSLFGHLFGSVKDVLYYSYLDTGTVWGSFRSLHLNPNDGDVITAILPQRDYLRVFMNMSQFVVFPGNVFEYERREMIEDLGCIAPHTALAYQNGVFYLSHQGLIYEPGTAYRQRGSQPTPISNPINNILLNRTRDALRKAYGIVHNEKYWLSFADVDTTFVYNLKTGGWSIYNYAFTQATFYDTAAANSGIITPSGDMVFINGETDQLYKADTSVSDNCYILNDTIAYGTVINTRYRTPPFSISPDLMSVSKFGIYRESNDATEGADVRIINAEGDTVSTTYMNAISTRYDIWGVNTNGSNYFQIDVSDTILDSLAIDRIDVWLYKQGTQPIK